MRLIPIPPGKFESGRILFKGKDLLKASELEMQKIRGNEISMIFQEPMTSLNPIFTIGDQITEAICLHQDKSLVEGKILALEVLKKVAMPSPEQRIDQYPHELSGGMKQRVMIAMAIVCQPSLLIADEPTTSLDVTIQAQYLDLLRRLQKDTGVGLIFVTHALGIVAKMCDDVIVMYAGKTVEKGSVREIFNNPNHPYTSALIRSVPKLGSKDPLYRIEGQPPDLSNLPQGCSFASRCAIADDHCFEHEPPLIEGGPRRLAACWKIEENAASKEQA